MAQETALEKRETQTIQAEQIREGPTYVPAIDIVECDRELLLLADMPGVRPDAVDVNYERGLPTIHGQVTPRQSPSTNYLLREYGVGDFQRRFEIGEGVDASAIAAELRDGVLTVTLPKQPGAQPKRVAAKSA